MQRQEALAGKHSRQQHKGCSFNVRAALLAISVSCTHTSTHTCTRTHNVHIIYGVNQRAVALRMRPQKSTGIRHVAHTATHTRTLQTALCVQYPVCLRLRRRLCLCLYLYLCLRHIPVPLPVDHKMYCGHFNIK